MKKRGEMKKVFGTSLGVPAVFFKFPEERERVFKISNLIRPKTSWSKEVV